MKKEQKESVIHKGKVDLYENIAFSIFSSVLCISISCDLINCYLCRIQRTEITKIFSEEIKMVKDSKLQLMYLMILFGLSIAPLIFYDASPTESEIFANAKHKTSNNNEKTGNQEKLLLAKARTERRSGWVKKSRTVT